MRFTIQVPEELALQRFLDQGVSNAIFNSSLLPRGDARAACAAAHSTAHRRELDHSYHCARRLARGSRSGA